MRAVLTPLVATVASAIMLAGCAPVSIPARTPPRPAAVTPTPFPTFGASPNSSLRPAEAAALQKALEASVGAGSDDALATVITADGIWSGAAGVDGPRRRRAQPGDVFSIASVTKTFTSALVFKLGEEGRIDLDAKLAKYLTGAAAAESNGATVRQALAMRAGIPDTTDESRNTALKDPTTISTVDDIVAVMPKPTAKPGAAAEESNPTYKLLALAAERAGGGTWADLVRAELVEPAHVPGTLLVQIPGVRTPGTWAVPTGDGPWGIGGTLPFLADTSFSHGATDMAADSRSLATWAWALVAGRIVSPASLAAMTVDDGSGIGSGLAPYSEPLPEGTIGHQGGKPGFGTIVVAIPSKHTVIAVAVNDEDAALDSIADDLLTALD